MPAIFRSAIALIALEGALTCYAAAPLPADALQQRIAIRWQDVPLRDICRRLEDTQNLTIWLDRRLDPSRSVRMQVDNEKLLHVLDRLAESCGAQHVSLPSLSYLGPPEAAAELPTLMEMAPDKLKALPAVTRRKLVQKKVIKWQRLATPRQVLRELTAPLGLQVKGLERIPHDLYDASSLPAATIADHLTFLLAPFDCTWRIHADGRKIEIIPIERPVRITRTYNWRDTSEKQLEAVFAQVPTVEMRVAGDKVTVNGTAQEHEKLRELLTNLSQSPRTGRRTNRPGTERKLFSLRLQDQPAGAVLRELARQLKLNLHFEDAAKPLMETRISVDVTQVPLDALLESIGEEAGLEVKATDTELQVSPR